MLSTVWNMSKHGFSLICICPYVEIICDSVHMDMILIQTEKLRLFCWRLRGGAHYDLSYLLWNYLGSLKLFWEGWQHQVLLIVVATTWSFSRSSKRFVSHWGSNVDAWSEVNSALPVAYSGPCQTSKMQLFAKNT